MRVEEKEKIVSVISNMYSELGEEKFSFVINSVMVTAKRKEEQGEKFTVYNFIESLLIALETVDKI